VLTLETPWGLLPDLSSFGGRVELTFMSKTFQITQPGIMLAFSLPPVKQSAALHLSPTEAAQGRARFRGRQKSHHNNAKHYQTPRPPKTSRSFREARKRTTDRPGISNTSRDRGSLPCRGARQHTSKLPNPLSLTFSPRRRASRTSSNSPRTRTPAWRWDNISRRQMREPKSALVKSAPGHRTASAADAAAPRTPRPPRHP
jgi:hypothetical protein